MLAYKIHDNLAKTAEKCRMSISWVFVLLFGTDFKFSVYDELTHNTLFNNTCPTGAKFAFEQD